MPAASSSSSLVPEPGSSRTARCRTDKSASSARVAQATDRVPRRWHGLARLRWVCGDPDRARMCASPRDWRQRPRPLMGPSRQWPLSPHAMSRGGRSVASVHASRMARPPRRPARTDRHHADLTRWRQRWTPASQVETTRRPTSSVKCAPGTGQRVDDSGAKTALGMMVFGDHQPARRSRGGHGHPRFAGWVNGPPVKMTRQQEHSATGSLETSAHLPSRSPWPDRLPALASVPHAVPARSSGAAPDTGAGLPPSPAKKTAASRTVRIWQPVPVLVTTCSRSRPAPAAACPWSLPN
jgi:hypothetical protein